jgi:hypothetical protein
MLSFPSDHEIVFVGGTANAESGSKPLDLVELLDIETGTKHR